MHLAPVSRVDQVDKMSESRDLLSIGQCESVQFKLSFGKERLKRLICRFVGIFDFLLGECDHCESTCLFDNGVRIPMLKRTRALKILSF